MFLEFFSNWLRLITLSKNITLFWSCGSDCTVEPQWLEHLWNHENMFETGVVRAYECESKRQVRKRNRDICSIALNMEVCCVVSLESPHRGDSNE